MAVLDPLLLAVTLAAVSVSSVLLWLFSPKIQEASEAAQEAVGDLAVEAGRVLRPCGPSRQRAPRSERRSAWRSGRRRPTRRA